MERSLQNPGTSSVRIDVGQSCCVPDDVLHKKRCGTHRDWFRHSVERDHESGILETNSFTGMLFNDD